MVKKLLLFLLLFSVASFAKDRSNLGQQPRKGRAPGYATRDATTLSMMGWGLGLAVGIAALCALIENNDSGSGGTSH